MATNADELSGGAPPNEDEQRQDDGQPDPQTNDQTEGEEGEVTADDLANDPVAKLAMDIGWVPKDQFKGPEDQWKPADEYIREGRNIQRSTSRELSQLRGTIDTIARTNAELMADRLAEQRRELTEKYNQYVEDGDAQAAFEASERLIALKQRAQQPVGQPAPSPEALEFQDRNASWFGKDQAATVRAQAVCNDLASRGVTDHATQLKAAERVIRAEYPEYFQNQQNGQQRPTPPQVATPGSRAPAPTNRAKGFAEMPLEARKVAERLVEAGAITDTKAYADKYWALQNQGSKR